MKAFAEPTKLELQSIRFLTERHQAETVAERMRHLKVVEGFLARVLEAYDPQVQVEDSKAPA